MWAKDKQSTNRETTKMRIYTSLLLTFPSCKLLLADAYNINDTSSLISVATDIVDDILSENALSEDTPDEQIIEVMLTKILEKLDLDDDTVNDILSGIEDMIKDVDIDDKYIPKKKDNDNVDQSAEADIDELGNIHMIKRDNINKVPKVTTINKAVQNKIVQEKKQDSKDEEDDQSN